MYSSFLFLTLVAAESREPPRIVADWVIRGALVYDGGGARPYVADLALCGDRIIGIGSFQLANRPVILDAQGLVAAPGFIDLHTHSDELLKQPGTRQNRNYLMQGVTTVVTGNCGAGPVDVAAYLSSLERGGIGTNVLHQVPHGEVRRRVMQNAPRPASTAELRQMELLVERGMQAGAWSISTGLLYPPGAYASTEELIALARIVAGHKGFYATHLRDEGQGLLPALEEALRIGKEAGLPVHVSHLKASGRRGWGKAADAVAVIEQAHNRGITVTADQYPYTAISTQLGALLIPQRFRGGSGKDFRDRLADPEQNTLIRTAIAQAIEDNGGAGNIRIATYQARPAWQGKDLEAISRAERRPVIDLVLDMQQQGDAQVVSFCLQEEEVKLIARQSFVATASDGLAIPDNDQAIPHPRSLGCFPRKIGRYAFAEKQISPQDAIRSATGLPADILKLPKRGYLKIGYFADIVLLDPQTFRDRATYDQPHQQATGVRYLFVNGKLVIKEGRSTGKLAGRVLRHRAAVEK